MNTNYTVPRIPVPSIVAMVTKSEIKIRPTMKCNIYFQSVINFI